VGRLDSRFTGIDRDAAGESFGDDPSYTAILGPYTAAMNAYVRTELKFESDLPYEILTGRVQPWSYAPNENRYVNVAETMRAAMSKNPSLKVLVMAGLFDLATPHFAAEYTLAQLGLEPELRGNISTRRYEAGHMMYVHEPSLRQVHRDAVEFIRAASGAGRR
jgi:carboxypeptidase C (cathepsin A)